MSSVGINGGVKLTPPHLKSQIVISNQEQLGWGKSIIENLAKDLQNEFPGMQGFSARNLWLIRSFYIEYKENIKLQPLVAVISWSQLYGYLDSMTQSISAGDSIFKYPKSVNVYLKRDGKVIDVSAPKNREFVIIRCE